MQHVWFFFFFFLRVCIILHLIIVRSEFSKHLNYSPPTLFCILFSLPWKLPLDLNTLSNNVHFLLLYKYDNFSEVGSKIYISKTTKKIKPFRFYQRFLKPCKNIFLDVQKAHFYKMIQWFFECLSEISELLKDQFSLKKKGGMRIHLILTFLKCLQIKSIVRT